MISKKYRLNNVAILVRAIYQTREFEERFLQLGIGYRVLGGIKFYERAEIKDAVSYLRIINQKFDDLALERVIGSPKRGVGENTLNQIYTFSDDLDFKLFIASLFFLASAPSISALCLLYPIFSGLKKGYKNLTKDKLNYFLVAVSIIMISKSIFTSLVGIKELENWIKDNDENISNKGFSLKKQKILLKKLKVKFFLKNFLRF